MVKPFKFTQNSGCLARDEYLVEGDHNYVDIHNYLDFYFYFCALYCTALISWCVVFAVLN